MSKKKAKRPDLAAAKRRREERDQPAARAAAAFDDIRFIAAVDVVRRTGCVDFEIRYSEPEHEGSPVVWIAIAGYVRDDGKRWLVGAHADPAGAAFRLAEQALNGGQCTHCGRPTGITADFDPMPAAELVCWYQYDPELKKYRRACEDGSDG